MLPPVSDLDLIEAREQEIREHRREEAAREQAEVMRLRAEVKKPSLASLVRNFVSVIFNPATPMANRARFIDMSHWNTITNVEALCAETDGFVFKCGGMDISDGKGAQKVYEDAKWAANVQIAYDHKKRIEAYFYADPDYHLLRQRSTKWVQEQDYKVNEVLIQLLTSLHNGPWTWDNLTADRGWKPIQAVWIDLEETDAWNGKITPVWQQVTLEHILEPLHKLQLAGKIPANWKLGVYTRPLFLRDDCKNPDGTNPLETYLWNRRTWVYIWFAQWIYSLDPDIQLPTLKALWDGYRPVDTFKFLYVPYQLENRIWHHQFTGEKFDVPYYTPEVDANLHFDTVAAYDKATGFTSTPAPEPPPVPPVPPTPPPPDLAALTARVDALEKDLAALKEKLNKILRLE